MDVNAMLIIQETGISGRRRLASGEHHIMGHVPSNLGFHYTELPSVLPATIIENGSNHSKSEVCCMYIYDNNVAGRFPRVHITRQS